ncbi:MAG: hypothetical protein GEU95_16390 [Rhizobiales bacterium]|nr:hypothetical protein [Hyphomicrobiales bacterium]
MFAASTSQLRVRHGDKHHRVTFVELFFDLVFVFAVTQLSHGLLKHLTPLGAVQTGLLMLGVWWVWIYTAWVTNWCDPDRPAVRLMLAALMLAGLVLSCSIPRAFEDRALPFALAYVFMQLGRTAFMLWVLKRHDPANFRNFTRIFVWLAAATPFWLAGAFAGATIAAFVVSFLGSVAMWAVYFNIGAERASHRIVSSDDPGRIARSGYTYLHLLIVAGIIAVAVGDELVLHHPAGHDGHTDWATAAAIIGGPLLYLIGNALFKRLSAPNLPLSHLVGIGLLALLAPTAATTTPLMLSAGVTVILIVVAGWEWLSLRNAVAIANPPY